MFSPLHPSWAVLRVVRAALLISLFLWPSQPVRTGQERAETANRERSAHRKTTCLYVAIFNDKREHTYRLLANLPITTIVIHIFDARKAPDYTTRFYKT